MNIRPIFDWIASTGPLGLLAILVAAVVFFARFALERRAKGLLLYSLLALLPLLVGLASTALGNAQTQRTVDASPGSAAPAELEHAQKQALRSTQLGGALTVLLLLLGLGSFGVRTERGEPVSPT